MLTLTGGRFRRIAVVMAVGAIALGALAGLVAAVLVARGFDARSEPGRLEALVARALLLASIPDSVAGLANPVRLTDAVVASGRDHFADHCALCHGNDGRGRTTLGRGTYPRAPDMTAARTQGLTDGQIFHIIRNGIRLTAMPAWGEGPAADDRESWHLVHFIRRIPHLTTDELIAMRRLNPKTPAQLEAEAREDAFLRSRDAVAPGSPAGHHHH